MRATYEVGSKQLKVRFQARLRILGSLPENEWREPHFKPLKGPCAGLSEIRFIADRVQQRPLGYRSGKAEYTILFWAREKGDKFVPANACELALARRNQIMQREAFANALWFALE